MLAEISVILGCILFFSSIPIIFMLARKNIMLSQTVSDHLSFIDRREAYHAAEVNRLNDEMFRLANRYKIVCDELEYFSLAKRRKAPVLKMVKKDGSK